MPFAAGIAFLSVVVNDASLNDVDMLAAFEFNEKFLDPESLMPPDTKMSPMLELSEVAGPKTIEQFSNELPMLLSPGFDPYIPMARSSRS